MDASFKDGKAGLGAVVVLPDGNADMKWTKACSTNSVEEAELLAVDFGISMALEQRLAEVEVMCDSQTTVKALVDKIHAPVWSLVGVFFNILESEKLFSKLVFRWIPRDVNVSAHQLIVWARNKLEIVALC